MCLYIVISGVLKQFEKVLLFTNSVDKFIWGWQRFLVSKRWDKGMLVSWIDKMSTLQNNSSFGKRDLMCYKNWDYSNILPALPPSKCYFRSPPGATDTVWGPCFARKIPLLMLLALKLPFLMLLQETRIWPRRRFYKWTNSSPPWKRWKILQNNFCLTKFVAS